MGPKEMEELIAKAIATAQAPLIEKIQALEGKQAEFEENLRKTGRRDLSEAITKLESDVKAIREREPGQGPVEQQAVEPPRPAFPDKDQAGEKVRLYCHKYADKGDYTTTTDKGKINWQSGIAELPYEWARELYEGQPSMRLA